MIKQHYKAVDINELRAKLGRNCSPSKNEKAWYVIGPDINDRLCHCATCPCELTAKRYAETINKNFK